MEYRTRGHGETSDEKRCRTTGQIIAQRRRDMPINTEVRTLDIGNPGAGDEVDENLSWDKLEDASQVKEKDK